jgi:hypothetical protein
VATGSELDLPEVRRSIEAFERRLRRGRLTVPAYASASLFFALTGFYTGAWTPALSMAALAALAGWVTHRLRRGWQTRMDALRELEKRVEAMQDESDEHGPPPPFSSP